MPLKVVSRKGTPTLYLRGTVRGISVFESTGTDKPSAAEEIRVKREAQLLEQSIHGKKATATFLEASVSYLAHGGSPRFVGEEVDGRWTGLIGHFKTRKLNTIGQSDLDDAAIKLYPTASPDTRNRQCYTPFIAIWNHAVRNGWADDRPWSRPRKIKGTAIRRAQKRSGTKPVDYETAASFVLAMSPAPAMAMTALFYTGMRPIELFALVSDDIDARNRWIVIRSSKTGDPRGVPMHEFVVPIFEALGKRGGHVFRTHKNQPYPLTGGGGSRLNTAIRGARERSGITSVSQYTARHSVSTQLVINRVPDLIKDQILGHSRDDMSARYTNVPRQPLIDAINTLPVPSAWRSAWWWEDPLAKSRFLIRKKDRGASRTAAA